MKQKISSGCGVLDMVPRHSVHCICDQAERMSKSVEIKSWVYKEQKAADIMMKKM